METAQKMVDAAGHETYHFIEDNLCRLHDIVKMHQTTFEYKEEATPQTFDRKNLSVRKDMTSSINNISQDSASVKEYSYKEVENITPDTYKTMKTHFGTTKNFKVAGYLLHDGTVLDFSGKHWRDTSADFRQVDHRDISYHELFGGYIDGDAFVPIRFGFKETKDGKITLHVVVSQEKIKTEVMGTEHMENSSGDPAPHPVTFSIPRVASFVNTPDLLRYLPDGLLNKSQKEIKYKALTKTIRYTNQKNDIELSESGFIGSISGTKGDANI